MERPGVAAGPCGRYVQAGYVRSAAAARIVSVGVLHLDAAVLALDPELAPGMRLLGESPAGLDRRQLRPVLALGGLLPLLLYDPSASPGLHQVHRAFRHLFASRFAVGDRVSSEHMTSCSARRKHWTSFAIDLQLRPSIIGPGITSARAQPAVWRGGLRREARASSGFGWVTWQQLRGSDGESKFDWRGLQLSLEERST